MGVKNGLRMIQTKSRQSAVDNKSPEPKKTITAPKFTPELL